MHTFTSESVTEGHPDKLADRVSDSVLDAVLSQDPAGRVACEVLIAAGRVVVAGEITTSAQVDYEAVVRQALREVGYTSNAAGIDADTCDVQISLIHQSAQIAAGVDGDELGAGDQGIIFGYAVDETLELMPLPIMLAHALTRQLALARKTGLIAGLRPDGKSQVTVCYEEAAPVQVQTAILAAQHVAGLDPSALRSQVLEHVIVPALGRWYRPGLDVRINTAGDFTLGGPAADAGLTGRKIIVDTYGGRARHGGGAFSGKDPTKVDRSGAYAARQVAKHVVAAGLAHECEIQIGYAIGESEPVSLFIECFGTERFRLAAIEQAVRVTFDLRPSAIISRLDLRRPIYAQTSAYGHMGVLSYPWEQLTMVDALRAATI